MYIKSVKFESNNSSYPKLLVLGAVHGNETCGSKAIKDIIDDINSDKIKLKQGSVTFIEKSNPKAYEENKRYHETNLNRVIKKMENPILYEEKLGNILTAHIDECEYMLDLHSMPENGTPFALTLCLSPF